MAVDTSLLSKSIPNLLGGVSQQPDSIRFDNQCDSQENCIPSVLDGIIKRPPTEHVSTLDASTPGNAEDYFTHIINLNSSQQYAVVIKADGTSTPTVNIRPLDDSSVPGVSYGSGSTPAGALDYLQMEPGFSASKDLRALTIADHTFIVNRSKTVAMDSSQSEDIQNPAALFYVKVGDYGTEYSASITVGGTEYKTVIKTPSGVQRESDTSPTGTKFDARDAVDTSNIATALATGAAHGFGDTFANGGTITLTNDGVHTAPNFTVSRVGSVIQFKRDDNSAFSISATDGLGNEAILGISNHKVPADTSGGPTEIGEIDQLAFLPTVAPHDFRIKITGGADSSADDYYVKFVADNGTFGSGIWKESRNFNMEYRFDYSTMPHVIVRLPTGNFTLQPLSGEALNPDGTLYTLPVWSDKNTGDDVSNPNPTFVGNKIKDVFLYKNRLGFLADENVILSETGEFFNFFRTTIVSLLDTSPIDVAGTHSSVSLLTSALSFSRQLILFSDSEQFALSSGQSALTPSTVTVTKTTSYDSVSDLRPIGLGNSIYFGFSRGEYSGIRQYTLTNDTETIFDAEDISVHVPRYIKGELRDVSGSTQKDMMFCLTNTNRNTVYCYKFYDGSRGRVQSAWSKFVFPVDTEVLGFEFVETTLYLITKRSDGVFLDKMRLESGLVDSGVSYLSHLDRRVDQSTTGVSVSGTSITLPYKVYTGTSMEVITKEGLRVPVVTQTNGSNVIVVDRDMTGINFWAGEAYTMSYKFSDLVLREEAQSGDTALISKGRKQLRHLTLDYHDSSFFKVQVSPLFRDTPSNYVFTGRTLGIGDNLLDTVPLASGSFRVPVYSRSDQVDIEITNDTPLPCAVTSAEFEMTYSPRGTRI